MSDRLYVGIDLGTYQSTISSSAGVSHTIETVVGRPKDPVARNFLGRDVLFGNDALKNETSQQPRNTLQNVPSRNLPMTTHDHPCAAAIPMTTHYYIYKPI